MTIIKSSEILSKVVKTFDNLAGHSARKLRHVEETLLHAPGMGIKGITPQAHASAKALADAAAKESLHTRVKAGIGAVGVLGAGAAGFKAYHNYQDNKILNQIDKTYYNA